MCLNFVQEVSDGLDGSRTRKLRLQPSSRSGLVPTEFLSREEQEHHKLPEGGKVLLSGFNIFGGGRVRSIVHLVGAGGGAQAGTGQAKMDA